MLDTYTYIIVCNLYDGNTWQASFSAHFIVRPTSVLNYKTTKTSIRKFVSYITYKVYYNIFFI